MMIVSLLVVAVAALATSSLAVGSKCVDGPCGPSHQRCGPRFKNAPRFHVMDPTCGENDPNGPMYDPVHGLYHLFYQDHLAIDPGKGPDWGHAVSRDFVHWAHLPVAIWNDRPYDRDAIYTGSATIVNGKPVIIYPGLCFKDEYPGCDTGTLLAIAVPENASDPLYTNWTKPAYNPIVNNTQRDPSTAWKTSHGEWRITTYDGTIYASADFVSWYTVGKSMFPTGECPSLFALPKPYPGAKTSSSSNAPLPTHVYKNSHDGKDWMQVGTYRDNAPGKPGTWTATPGFSFAQAMIDQGDFYASKDFYDPVKDRRINFGWAIVPPASTQSLPRHLTWHPTLQQLMHSPVEEQKQLRGDVLANVSSPQHIPANGQHYLGDWPNTRGNQSEVVAVFRRPNASVAFGVDVMTNSDPTAQRTRIYVEVEVNPATGDATAVAGISAGSTPPEPPVLTAFMNHTDLPGGDFNVTDVNYTDPRVCQAVCLANPACEAWTYVVRGPLYASCCQKGGYGFAYNPSNPTCTSGVRHPQPARTAKKEDVLRLLPSDDTIEVRVFTDNTFIEAYWMDGRVAMTSKLLGQAPEAGISTFAIHEGVTLQSASVWHVNSIWVAPEDVLAGLSS